MANNRPRKKSTKNAELKKQYDKERNRILRRINDYEKKGLIVNLEVPKIPKTITEGSIRRLTKITLKTIREKTKFVDYESGEVLGNYYTYKKAIKESPSLADSAANEFETWLTEFISELSNPYRKAMALFALEKLQMLKERLDPEDYAKMILKSQKNGTILDKWEVYKSEETIISGYERMLANIGSPPIVTDMLSDR